MNRRPQPFGDEPRQEPHDEIVRDPRSREGRWQGGDGKGGRWDDVEEGFGEREGRKEGAGGVDPGVALDDVELLILREDKVEREGAVEGIGGRSSLEPGEEGLGVVEGLTANGGVGVVVVGHEHVILQRRVRVRGIRAGSQLKLEMKLLKGEREGGARHPTHTRTANKRSQLPLDDARVRTPLRPSSDELLKRIRRPIADRDLQSLEPLPRFGKLIVVSLERVRRQIGSAKVVEFGGAFEDERMRRGTDDGERGGDRGDGFGRGGEEVEGMDEFDEEVL
jgi:hypothetical protein